MEIYCYKHKKEYFSFTTELSEFDLAMNGMELAEYSLDAEIGRVLMEELEGHLNPLLQVMPGADKQHSMNKLVAMLVSMAKADGFDLGWEHKKTTPYHRE